MAKSDGIALNKLQELVKKGYSINIETKFGAYEVTVWPNPHDALKHHHYAGETLIEAIMKIK